MTNTRKRRRLTPLNYTLKSIKFRKRAFFEISISLSTLLTFLLLLEGMLEGSTRVENPSETLLDFRRVLAGWFRVILLLYLILIFLLSLGYFLLTAAVRGEESYLLRSLGMSRIQIDSLFALEAFIITTLAAGTSAAASWALLPLFPLLFPSEVAVEGVFSPEILLNLFTITLLSSTIGAFTGGEISQKVRGFLRE